MRRQLDSSEPERWHQRCSLALAPVTEAASGHATGRLAAAAAEWRECDLVWEQYQEQAGLAYRDGDVLTPPRLWARALEIADRWFARGDPRLATSLTNQALVLRRRGQVQQAEWTFARAFKAWDDSWRWVSIMVPPGTPDAAAGYDHETRATFHALIERGRAATAALERYDSLPVNRLDLWFELRPSHLSDLRKLLGAVLLIAPDPPGSSTGSREPVRRRGRLQRPNAATMPADSGC